MSPMHEDKQDQRGAWPWALPASVATHLLVVALLIFGLPKPLSSSQEEAAVNVELVPPPAPQEAAESPTPAQAAERKPQPQAASQSDAEPSPPDDAAARQAPSPVMQPVFQFGEKDAGPRQSLDGNSPEDGVKTPAEDAETATQAPVNAESTQEPDKKEGTESRVSMVEEPEAQESKPADDPVEAAPLAEAGTLFSRAVFDDPAARTAMGKIPRDIRGGRLCGTELREQLVHSSPPYFPDLLPSVRLQEGTVIEVTAAFHANSAWRAVSYRCEVDAEAMKVVSFALNVGAPIPRADWERLGLPAP